jgi:hypothetical protein
MDEAVRKANNDVSQSQPQRAIDALSSTVDPASAKVDQMEPIADAGKPLLDKLQCFMKLMDDFSEVRFRTIKPELPMNAGVLR